MSDESDDEADSSYPFEVEVLHQAIQRLVAVTGVSTGLKDLAQFENAAATWSFRSIDRFLS